MPMTFDLIRVGWPNTAAILALAILPAVGLQTDERPNAVQVERAEAAANWQAQMECEVTGASATA